MPLSPLTRRLRAENVGIVTMQKLYPADGRVINYKGFRALLRLDSSIDLSTKKPHSIVELEFDNAQGHQYAEGEFRFLTALPFYDPDHVQKLQQDSA
jgi:hypothetical protein